MVQTSEISGELVRTTSEVLKIGDPDGLIYRVAWVSADKLLDLRLSHEDHRRVLMAFMGVS